MKNRIGDISQTPRETTGLTIRSVTLFQSSATVRTLFSIFFFFAPGIFSALFAQSGPGSVVKKTIADKALEREARLLEWYNADSRGGLFIHWGLGTGKMPGTLMYPDVKAFEAATAAADWSPHPIVDAAVKLHCKYIIWATLHVEHGLLRTWKSKIPGTPVTQRDYLGELCRAAAPKGIKIVIYLTGDAATKPAKISDFIDGAGYAKYKHMDLDIRHNNDHWIRYYLKDVMLEILDNYPDVIGFWCDGWDSAPPDEATMAAVHAKNPHALIFRNEYGNKPAYADEDVMGIEPFAKILSPEYDKASSMYVKSGNGVEGSFIISSEWWYTGIDFSPPVKWCVKMMASALGGNMVPCYAEGANIGGKFGPKVNAANDSLKKFLDYAAIATRNIWGGGYAHGGFKSGTAGDSAYVATTLSKDGNTHFIHVLKRPVTRPDLLQIPALGYRITGVRLLATNKKLPYRIVQDRLEITVRNWNKFEEYGDEIIQITTAGKPNLVSHSGWNIRAGNEDGAYPASNAIDSSQDTYYSSQNDAKMPMELTIDMGGNHNIAAILLNQYEARALTAARYYPAGEGTRIKDYEVYASSNGTDWGSALASGALENERGVKEIPVPQGTGSKRYIKLRVLNNYKGNGLVQITNMDLIKK